MSCPSSTWHWDSNPQPSERESPPKTTRPGLSQQGYLRRSVLNNQILAARILAFNQFAKLGYFLVG